MNRIGRRAIICSACGKRGALEQDNGGRGGLSLMP
jgi:hypothetical protein